MHLLAWIGAILALLMYVPLCIGVWKGAFTQNLATFILWGLLDSIAAGSIYLQGGNFLLPLFYVIGCVSVITAILRAGSGKWTWRETLTAVLVMISILVWMFVGNWWATIVSTIGVVVAALPQLIDNWEDPRTAPFWTYAGFTAGNFLSLLAGNDWSIEERFYPTACTILTAVFVLVATRKWLPAYRTQLAM